MESATLLSELRDIMGESNVIDRERLELDMELPAGWRDAPLAMLRPTETDHLPAIVCAAEATGVAVLPYGGGTQWATGNPPTAGRPYLIVRTDGLNRILDYQPEDLTITCEPGVTLTQLQQSLAERKQFLPLDVPIPTVATIGGIVATNDSAFWRASYGAPRDLVIGVRAVMTDGKLIRGGGKVVKNVAGYDLCKLFTGSWGAFGVLSEVTFKIRSRPESKCVLAWAVHDLPSAARLGLSIRNSRLGANYALVTNEMDDGPSLLVGMHGTFERMEWQAEEVSKRVADSNIASHPRALTAVEIDTLRDRQARLDDDFVAAVKIVCLPTEVDTFVRSLGTISGAAITAACSTGVVNVALRSAEASIINAIGAARPIPSTLTWMRVGRDHDRSAWPIWGEERGDMKLMKGLKAALDPKSTFNPGRFVGGL